MLDETTFDRISGEELKHLDRALSALDGAEVEFNGEVLSCEFADGGTMVINSHRAARQIWLSAELRAAHFAPDEATGRWLDTKSGEDLRARVAAVVRNKLGVAVAL